MLLTELVAATMMAAKPDASARVYVFLLSCVLVVGISCAIVIACGGGKK